MELIYDYTSIFMAGLAVGLIGAHWINKGERKLQYEIGYNAGFNAIWYPVFREYLKAALSGNVKHKTDGRGSSVSTTT